MPEQSRQQPIYELEGPARALLHRRGDGLGIVQRVPYLLREAAIEAGLTDLVGPDERLDRQTAVDELASVGDGLRRRLRLPDREVGLERRQEEAEDAARALQRGRGVEAAYNDLVSPKADAPLPFAEASEILDNLPNLQPALAAAEPELRRQIYDAFRLRVEIDRNEGLVTLKALVSSAFGDASNLDDVVANGAIAGAGFEPATFGL